VSHLDGSALFALAGSCKDFDFRLQASIWKYNIKFQNSNLLHLAVKYDNVALAEALLQNNTNINAFYRGKTPLIRAPKYSSAAVCELLSTSKIKRAAAPCRMPCTMEISPPSRAF
jgi:hypothetical protein